MGVWMNSVRKNIFRLLIIFGLVAQQSAHASWLTGLFKIVGVGSDVAKEGRAEGKLVHGATAGIEVAGKAKSVAVDRAFVRKTLEDTIRTIPAEVSQQISLAGKLNDASKAKAADYIAEAIERGVKDPALIDGEVLKILKGEKPTDISTLVGHQLDDLLGDAAKITGENPSTAKRLPEVKRPGTVKQEVYDEWIKLRQERARMSEQVQKQFSAGNYNSPEYVRYKSIGDRMDKIEKSNLDLRRADRRSEPWTDSQIKETLDVLVNETFRFNVGGSAGSGRPLRPGYENMNLGQASRDRAYREALTQEFQRLYYQEAIDYGDALDLRLQQFTTNWFYPQIR